MRAEGDIRKKQMIEGIIGEIGGFSKGDAYPPGEKKGCNFLRGLLSREEKQEVET